MPALFAGPVHAAGHGCHEGPPRGGGAQQPPAQQFRAGSAGQVPHRPGAPHDGTVGAPAPH